MDASLGQSRPVRGRPPNWNPIFWPPQIKKQHIDFTVEKNALSNDNLLKLGEQISEVREKLKKDALFEANKVRDSEIVELKDGAEKIIKKINRGYAKRFCIKSKDIENKG